MKSSAADSASVPFWSNPDQLVAVMALYAQVRQRTSDLHGTFDSRASTPELLEVGKALGLRQGKTLVFKSDEEMTVFRNHLYYFNRLHRTTPVERYLKSVDRRGEDEVTRAVHDALAGLRFMFFAPVKLVSGCGVVCRDGLTDQQFFLVDRGFSRLTTLDVSFASSLLPVGEAWMTTGASIPFDGIACSMLCQGVFHELKFPRDGRASLTPNQQSKLALHVARMAIDNDCLRNIRYD